ncbi:MAG: macro domain-containing protein, partial [Usitatibacter sp.]
HTAGPIWSASQDRSAVLRSCYAESLRVADGLGARSVAFPAISAGVYGYPKDEAARVARAAIERALAVHTSIIEVRLVFFSETDAQIAMRAAGA